MSNIKNEDMDKNKYDKLTAEEMEQVKGGPAYIKIAEVEGEMAAMGDGSVKPGSGGGLIRKVNSGR